jgi:O-antigen/teichoic acid export membrane protein
VGHPHGKLTTYLDDPGIKRKVDRGVAWVGMASSLVAFCDVVALALILRYWVDPGSFGVVTAVVTVFPALILIAELGLPGAVIQGPEPTDDRLSTLFWLEFASGATFYILIYAVAPLIAHGQGHEEVTRLFRVSGIVLLIRPLYTIHRAMLRRQLRFKELSVVRMIANFVEFGVKLGTAAAGYGIWCFAVAPIARELAYAIGMPACLRWRPRMYCKPSLAVPDVKFGLRTSASEIAYQTYSNLHYQVVSVFFGAHALGLYRAAYELVIEPVRFVSEVVTVVAFPTFARLRHDRPAVVEQFVAFTRQNLIVVLTLVALIVVAAGDMLTVLIGPQYAPAATAARILAVVGVFRALSHLGPPLLDGLGRPDLTLRYQVTALIVLSALFVLFASIGRDAGFVTVAMAWAVGYPIAFTVLSIMVFQQMQLPVIAFLRRIRLIVVLIVAGGAIGGGVHLALLSSIGASTRLAVTAAAVVGVSLGLLAAFREFSPRGILRSLAK